MSIVRISAVVALLLVAASVCAKPRPWLGVHLGVGNDSDLTTLEGELPALAALGVNHLVVEVNYSFQFKSRPEMADPKGISLEGARKFAAECKKWRIEPIPEINCLGHQSWAETTESLLLVHPELDETPGLYPGNKGIYCRSWCPLNPDLPKVVFPLVDELVDAFHARQFHCGMDEVFLIGEDACPRCHGQSKAVLFAKSVNDFHDHLKRRHIQMLMWGDRFLDGKATGYGEWEASENGTFPAISQVPKDIILCDWHYEVRPDYPSIKILSDAGFRVWPSTWRNAQAATAFSSEARAESHGKVLGLLGTVWGEVKIEELKSWPPLAAAYAPWRQDGVRKQPKDELKPKGD